MSCSICCKPSINKYVSYTMSYYRNKAYENYFCSNECVGIFNMTKKCKYCGYGGDLELTTDGFVVCTSGGYLSKYSCNDKYKMCREYELDDSVTLTDKDIDHIRQQGFLPDHLEPYSNKIDVRGLLMRIRCLETTISDLTQRLEALESSERDKLYNNTQ